MKDQTKTTITESPAPSTPAVILENGMTVPATFEFKSPALTASAEVIARNAIDMKENVKAIASELGKIMTSKSYEEDGYKSVADFAEKVFNIGRSQAYAWAEVGAKFLNADSESAKVVASLPLANAAVVASLTDEEVQNGVKSGKITANSTQADLKAYKEEVKASRPVDPKAESKVLPMFEYIAFFGNRAIPSVSSMLEVDISTSVSSAVGYSTIIEEVKLPDIKPETKGTPATKRRLIIFDDNGNPAPVLVEYRMKKSPAKTSTKVGAKSIHDLSAAELVELLKAAREREAAQVVEV